MLRTVLSLAVLSIATAGFAGDCVNGACGLTPGYGPSYGAACGPTTCYVAKTIMVPEYYTETVVVKSTTYQTEWKERVVNYTVQVPVKTQVPYEYTVYEHQTQTRTENYTVQVPVWKDVVQNYTVQVPVYKDVVKEYTVQVPVWKDVVKEYTVQVPVWKDVVQNYTVQVPTYKDVTKEYTVQVPYTEARQGTRKVCRTVQVQREREVCVNQGHWEERAYTPTTSCYTGCGSANWCGSCGTGCGPAGCGISACAPAPTCTYKVWVNNIVKQVVPYTACETVWSDEPYTYNVCLYRPEVRTCTYKVCEYVTEPRTRTCKVCEYVTEPRTCTVKVCEYQPQVRTCTYKVCEYATEPRTRTCKVCEYVSEPRTREVCYTVCVPVKKQGVREVCNYVSEPRSRTEKYCVVTPVTVEKPIEVKRCRLVCQTIQVPVTTCCAPISTCCKPVCCDD